MESSSLYEWRLRDTYVLFFNYLKVRYWWLFVVGCFFKHPGITIRSRGTPQKAAAPLSYVVMRVVEEERVMSTAKEEVKALLDKLPDDCSLEDVQYHLYVVEKIHRGIERAEKEGVLGQDEVERKFDKWTSK